jgi:hypothetical protein
MPDNYFVRWMLGNRANLEQSKFGNRMSSGFLQPPLTPLGHGRGVVPTVRARGYIKCCRFIDEEQAPDCCGYARGVARFGAGRSAAMAAPPVLPLGRGRTQRLAFRSDPGHEGSGRVRSGRDPPEICDVERPPDDPAAMALDLGDAWIDVIDVFRLRRHPLCRVQPPSRHRRAPAE